MAKLLLKDGSEYIGESFGAEKSIAGEVVFATGMVGYPESLTDPSFLGQILVYTYPLVGNYGAPDKKFWESDGIKVSGLIVCNYNATPSHWQSRQTLSQWLKKEKIPALEIKDTRGLTQKLREHGVMLGKMTFDRMSLRGVHPTKQSLYRGNKIASDALAMTQTDFYDPNLENLVAKVSTKKIIQSGGGKKAVVLIDCGAKRNIARCLEKRGLTVVTVPWDFDPTKLKQEFKAAVISNGPGDPGMNKPTIANIQKLMKKKYPILGICLGNQLLALAAGGATYKLKFGHRSQNQPCVLSGSKKCYLTTQNHGYAVGKIPKGFKEWFYNANDNTNEGIIHQKMPWMSVQFHPEATPGPVDTEWVFDYFLKKVRM